jgi:hypothetical protein
MPSVGFEPTIPAFERAKTVHVLDHEATVIGKILYLRRYTRIFSCSCLLQSLHILSLCVLSFVSLMDPNPSSRTMALVMTQPLTEMSSWNLPAGKAPPARKADNLTAICVPID